MNTRASSVHIDISMIRATVHFTGRVQGVGFRATARAVAEGYRVSGWVRNESDGSVQCVIEGERDEVHRCISAIHQAMDDCIDDSRVDEGRASGELAGFAIRR